MKPRFATVLIGVGVCCSAGLAGAAPLAAAADPSDWPRIQSAIAPDAALEARVQRILRQLTLAQKVGQMTQAEVGSITAAQTAQYAIGSVLSGGGSWPHGNKHAPLGDWLALADAMYDASQANQALSPVPPMWGTDAVHGHGNVYGATLFPHNIGLGASGDLELVRQVGAAVGRQVRASGLQWVFGPTVAVAQDPRWGRTYESFSADPALVRACAEAYVAGLQGRFEDAAKVVATAKHFIGDGATEHGIEKGLATIGKAAMVGVHAQGFYGALAAGAQTVMVSFNGWNDVAAGVNYGEMHGSKTLLTDVLKGRMGFDGFVVSDWNGIAQVPGCTPVACAKAINAGIDMAMVPHDWKAFIANTIEQVQRGEIAMARIDDAVSRILRVKLRSGVFDQRPSAGAYAGHADALQARDLARQAVRQSLVLLKNRAAVLPLARAARLLVVGRAADSLQHQTGGWTLTWQGTENTNQDFVHADSILAGLRAVSGSERIVFSESAQDVDLGRFDAVIAVIGEDPYAEGKGDLGAAGSLSHSSRYPQDLALLRSLAGQGKPVVALLLTGRPVYANDLLNLADAFVVAWLPGTEGKGVADVLLRTAGGAVD
ncbi:MAG: glycoside hydrolase family 3 protein [Rhodoferax sp.]